MSTGSSHFPPNLTSCVQFLPSKKSSDKPTKCSALIHTVYYWDGKNHQLLKIFCLEDTTTYLPIAMDHLIHRLKEKKTPFQRIGSSTYGEAGLNRFD